MKYPKIFSLGAGGGSGTVTSVTGTANRITIGGTASDPTVDISTSYAGQNTITTLGTISTGTWNATVLTGQYGGTGVANTGKTITLGGNLTTSGAFATTLTVTNTTNVTLPTTGTLATLAGSEAFTNKTYNGLTITSSTGTLTIANSKVVTVSNTLTFTGTDSSSVAFGAGGTVLYEPGTTYTTTTGSGFTLSSSTLTSGNLVALTITGTGALTNQTVLNISVSGANATGAQTTYAGQFSNTHTGTSVNIAAKFVATGGSSNYAIVTTGNVGINKLTPTVALDIVGDGATVTIKPTTTTEAYFSSLNFSGNFFNIGAGTAANNYSFFNTDQGRFAMFFSSSEKFSITSAGNVGIGINTFGSSATQTFSIFTGTAPGSSTTDAFQMYSADIAAGNAAPHFRTENGTIVKLFKSSAYTPTNVTTDRTFDANATTVDELADVLGTLIADLQLTGLIG